MSTENRHNAQPGIGGLAEKITNRFKIIIQPIESIFILIRPNVGVNASFFHFLWVKMVVQSRTIERVKKFSNGRRFLFVKPTGTGITIT